MTEVKETELSTPASFEELQLQHLISAGSILITRAIPDVYRYIDRNTTTWDEGIPVYVPNVQTYLVVHSLSNSKVEHWYAEGTNHRVENISGSTTLYRQLGVKLIQVVKLTSVSDLVHRYKFVKCTKSSGHYFLPTVIQEW